MVLDNLSAAQWGLRLLMTLMVMVGTWTTLKWALTDGLGLLRILRHGLVDGWRDEVVPCIRKRSWACGWYGRAALVGEWVKAYRVPLLTLAVWSAALLFIVFLLGE